MPRVSEGVERFCWHFSFGFSFQRLCANVCGILCNVEFHLTSAVSSVRWNFVHVTQMAIFSAMNDPDFCSAQ